MKITYINISTNNPRDTVTIRGLRENGIEVTEITDNALSWKKFWKIYKKLKIVGNSSDLIIVGYTGAILVPWIKLITRKKIVYNTLTSLYEGMIVSRQVGSRFSWVAFKWWLVDYFAFLLAHQILVDSKIEKQFVSKTFHINPKKISVHFTGVNEGDFYFDSQIKKLDQFTVVFRGRFLPEAGVNVIIRAAKILEAENIAIRIIGNGFLEQEITELIAELKPKNLELIAEKLSFAKLRQKMGECHISLGQVANHPRLERSIPHKVFESLIMKIPYLTGQATAISEILKENETCFFSIPGDEKSLAKKLIELKNQNQILGRVAEKGFELYQNQFTPKKLGTKLKKTIFLA